MFIYFLNFTLQTVIETIHVRIGLNANYMDWSNYTQDSFRAV